MEGETDMNNTLTTEIPTDVKDNSETVTDYAFSRHRSPDRGVTTPDYRDRTISYADLFGYTLYSWHDVNQGTRIGWGAGQRCRFDMLVNKDGRVVHLFHTEYWTRVMCHRGEWCRSYAVHYVQQHGDESTDPVPYCDEHLHHLRRSVPDEALTLSERLWIGQHD